MSFASLGLSPAILEAVAEQGYTVPSPIQAAAIPAAVSYTRLTLPTTPYV